MDYSIFVSAHGDRRAGTSKGTFVLPRGVNLYFYTDDAALLKGRAGMDIEDCLTTPSLDEDLVKANVKTLHQSLECVPNYIATGSHSNDRAFQMKTGVYYVGSPKGNPPALRLRNHQQVRLSDIIYSFHKVNSSFPTDVFWLCCRAAPQNSNRTFDVSSDNFSLV